MSVAAQTRHEAIRRVLLVGGDEAEYRRVRGLLRRASLCEYQLVHAASWSRAYSSLELENVDVLVVRLTDRQDDQSALEPAGFESGLPPMVALGSDLDEAAAIDALERGARSYLVLEELCTRSLVGALEAAIASQRAIDQLQIAQEHARRLASHDQLTGLANRRLFQDRLEQALATARRIKRRVAVLYIDLDGFKLVNDTLGHAAGDGLLRSVAEHLTANLRESDTAARLGGDEFAVLLTNLNDELDASTVATKILNALCHPMPLREHHLFTSASIGIATFPAHGREPEDLIKKADTAMYQAKDRGRNRFEFYSREMNETMKRRLMLETGLRRATAEAELRLFYQPQLDLRRERIVGAEALLRWLHPDLGLLTPDQFLPLAEETGQILEIGEWVLRTACEQNVKWQAIGPSGFRVSVNVSSHQLQSGFSDLVSNVLTETGLQPEFLELEITESCVVNDAEVAISALHTLKQLGVHISIDDFGTGYSALAYLKYLPIDALKIDQSFVRSLTTDPADATIIEAIVKMAHGLNLTTVAEGVETQEQLLLLGSYGCNRMQGYLFGRPVPPSQFQAWLEQPKFRWRGVEA